MLKSKYVLTAVLAASMILMPVSQALAVSTVVNSPVAGSSDPLTIRKAFQLDKKKRREKVKREKKK